MPQTKATSPFPNTRAPIVRAAGVSDAEEVSRFLAKNMGRGLSPATYERLFRYPWRQDSPHHGFVLIDAGTVVGFYGAIHATRVFADTLVKVCNLTNWCVLPAYRRFSMHLLFPMLKAPDTLFTNLSPTPEVQPFFERLGFSVLDTYKWFSLPLTQASKLFRSRARIHTAADDIAPRLDAPLLQVFRDHQGIGCRHLLLEHAGECCYIVTKKRKRKGLTFSEVLFASSKALLRRHFEQIKLAVLLADRTGLLACDERLYGGRPSLALRYRRVTLVKNASVPFELIDNLYSEVALL